MYKKIDSKMNLPKTEEEILSFWDKNNIFQKSLDIRKDAPIYSFYDGPPFATGTPHYGHIVGSTMKDVVPRYWTMKGYYVKRVWGWDCHGLPIENIAEKELGIKNKKEILELGVKKFNDVCRSKIAGYTKEWEIVINRLGRWVDMKNAYRTMDLPYMESVWWVFKELWDKGLIYEGYKSMHICPRCETTLSQSEVSEGYKDVKDLSVIAKFELVDQSGTFVLAWTTTPWTLIGNVALAVGEKIKYVKVESGESCYILAKSAFENYHDKFNDPKIIEELQGSDLVGKEYLPIFDYYAKDKSLKNKQNGWKIYAADFVTTDEGTGVVHIAPAFGEDDMKLGKEKDLPFVQHVRMDGIIKDEVKEFAGMHVKPIEDVQKTDVEIIKYLAHQSLLFDKGQYLHSYPHCWRCETPLINYATSSWFVNIFKLKNEALTLAENINWFPKNIKNGRFGKWLEGARDWSISRQRFWASGIPIWVCDRCGEKKVIGSVAELKEISGVSVTDLHKEVIDKIHFNCSKCDGTMNRIPDVLDCWFESGSMPYAQMHYPFENIEQFEKGFPADYIAEGPDQTRAWFYYLHVLAVGMKSKIAYKNVIVNGIVLAEDGKKMSKRLHNYPDPMEMFNKYGADVMRFYLMSSPVVQAENINFSESEMADISRGMFRMLWNSYSFFVLYANIDGWKYNENAERSENVLDRWIISEFQSLTEEVNKGIERYDLIRTSRLFPLFIDNLSNWYIRRSRKRFWKSENDSDKNSAYQTLYTILVELSKLMAPFTPFISEEIFTNLTGRESVHLEKYPESQKNLIDESLNKEMTEARLLIEVGLAERAKAGIKVRQPLQKITYFGEKLRPEFEQIVKDEVNVKEAIWSDKAKNVAMDTIITPELKAEGDMREIIREIQSLRKEAKFNVEDRINLSYFSESEAINYVFSKFGDILVHEVLANKLINKQSDNVEIKKEFKFEDCVVWIGLSRVK